MKVFFCTLIASLLLGAGQVTAHSWYSGTVNPVTKMSCCGKVDCVPIKPGNLKVEGKNFVFVYPRDGKTYSIPVDQALPSQDFNTHVCVWHQTVGEYRAKNRHARVCIFIGGGM